MFGFEARPIKVVRVRAKNAFGRTRIPDARFVLNQYIGCLHACKYCYAKFICRGYEYGKWGEWVVVRENIPELVRGRFVRGTVYMSSVSDAYQPIEEKLSITRRILENMNKLISLKILTKSDLVLRDIDVLKLFRNVEVGLTINSFERKIRREIEPRATDMERRFNALKELKENCLRNYGFIAPVIPELTDLELIFNETKDFVDYYVIEVLNLKASGEFRLWLMERYPKSYEILTDYSKLRKFVLKIEEIVSKSNVNVRGIITHPQVL